ncbi:TIGR00269 family protein [Candidatus Woesearchaeota archaeon]|nr:TIGR00269 family protein [Candidatus Woesearchaeota archaeon]
MNCLKCEQKAVYDHLGLRLCKDHFLRYFEKKVADTIKKYDLISEGDKICVAASGGKDSLAVLYCTMLYCRKYKIEFFALAIDEGIKGYRDHTLDDLRAFCKEHDIRLHITSFKENHGSTLDDIREKAMKKLNKKPCTVCGILRRTDLNRAARKLEATKLVTGHNLDDESQSFMMNSLLGNMGHNASLGPITGLNLNEKFVPRVKPLYFVSEKETRLYTFLKGFKVNFAECPNIHLSYRSVIRDKLNELEERYPGTKNGMVNGFLEILPLLKEKYKGKKAFSYCEKCGDACSGKICNACRLESELIQ